MQVGGVLGGVMGGLRQEHMLTLYWYVPLPDSCGALYLVVLAAADLLGCCAVAAR